MPYPIVESHGKQYKLTDTGTYYDPDTPDSVVSALEYARQSRTRIRFWYGKDGKSWGDEFDIMGTIGRSWGPVKIPILIHNSRSMGGGAILTGRILRIVTTGGRELYRADNWADPQYSIVPPYSEGYVEAVADDSGAIVAQFQKAGQAARWIQFMKGERFSK